MNWVENMNSLLDDSKKLTLLTGESLVLNNKVKIVFETNDLSNCSPATISRCGLVCMADNNLSIKAMLNRYLRKLPNILNDQLCKLDKMFNYFFPDIFSKFITEDNQSKMHFPVSPKFALKNFLRFYDACIGDYSNEKFNSWAYIKNAYDMKMEEVNNDGISEDFINKQQKYKAKNKTCCY